MRGTNKGPLTVEQGPKFIIHWVINSILWIASQCPHPGTIDDIQPTWLNPISKGDGWSWAHLPCNHIIAVWVNQTWIKRFLCSSWQTENWEAETMPHAESGCHQVEITAGIFLFLAYAQHTIIQWKKSIFSSLLYSILYSVRYCTVHNATFFFYLKISAVNPSLVTPLYLFHSLFGD